MDVCLPAERVIEGWSYVDLELDIFQYADGTVQIKDRDEFDDACRNGWIRIEDARIAHETASAMHMRLYKRQESIWEQGWQRLKGLQQFPPLLI
jgi:predicted RNA-binding protein associated with RNAse of E/G family